MIYKAFIYSCVLVAMTQCTSHNSDPDLDPCEPDCTGQAAGTRVPDPRNCHRYYTCLEDKVPSDVVFTCQGDQKFDLASATCSEDHGNITCGTCEAQCTYDCPSGAPSLVASRFNCSMFVLCGMGEQDPIECPVDAPYFDGAECQGNDAFCCDPCEVFCRRAYTEIADPTDCHSFYFCGESLYFPGAEDLHQCPSDGVFHRGQCHPQGSVPCEEPCAEEW